ncbi:MAG: hypothetical protein M0R06_13025 [Sphaerochaeta sp.]|jgi:hypothetical protein|nr:hypothetical protein [Sphaerochaeta sp.]
MREFLNGVVRWTLPVAGPSRTITIPALTAYVNDNLVTMGQVNKLLGANSDFDLQLSARNDGTGKYHFVFSEIWAAAPPLPPDRILLCRIRTDSDNVTAVFDLSDDVPMVEYGAAAPGAGDYEQGDIVFNNDPDDAERIGWVCTVAGAPGTWEEFGIVGDIDTAHIANNAIDTDQLAIEAVTTSRIDDDAVTTDKLDDGAVTPEKTSDIPILYYLGDPLLAVDDDIVGSTNMIVGDYTLSSDPNPYTMDVPRIVTVTRTVDGNADTPGTITVEGTDIADSNIVDVISVGAHGVPVEGIRAFKTVTKVTGSGWVIDGNNDTIEIGFGDDLGLPVIPSAILISILGEELCEADGVVSVALAQCRVDMSTKTYDGAKKAFVFLAL